MRSVRQADLWRQAGGRTHSAFPKVVPVDLVGDGVTVDVTFPRPFTVVAGANGSGKSRLLEAVKANSDAGSAVLIRLHELCEWLRRDLHQRSDISGFAAEHEALEIDSPMRAAAEGVVGRDYAALEWFALDIGESPFEEIVGAGVVPYFRATYGSKEYDSTSMGLGELAAHVLLWIMFHLRESKGRLLLLDEPDAYFPPQTVGRLYGELLRLTKASSQALIVSTHSQHVIEMAAQHSALQYLLRDAATAVVGSADEHPGLGRQLLAKSPLRPVVIFSEDQLATMVVREALRLIDPLLHQRSHVMWVRGTGEMAKLQGVLQRPDRSPVTFIFGVDADQPQLATVNPETSAAWPYVRLPGTSDPDVGMRTLKMEVDVVADCLGVDAMAARFLLSGAEGKNAHDWTEDLVSQSVDRVGSLARLARAWVERHVPECLVFVETVRGVAGRP